MLFWVCYLLRGCLSFGFLFSLFWDSHRRRRFILTKYRVFYLRLVYVFAFNLNLATRLVTNAPLGIPRRRPISEKEFLPTLGQV
jgi:hypothetical protein